MLLRRAARAVRTPWVRVASAVAVGAALTAGAVIDPLTVGPKPDGTAILPNGWKVTPAGQQVPLGEMPFGSALSPDGKTLLVSNNGQGTQSVQVVDVASNKVVQTIGYTHPESVYIGVAWSPDGTHAYASAGVNDKIRVYDVAGQKLTETAPITLAGDPVPAGLAVSADGKRLYVAGQHTGAVSVVDLATGQVTATIPVGPTPYTVQLADGDRTAFVSSWGGNTVTVIDTTTNTVRRTSTVGTHPSALVSNPIRGQVYVANSDSDDVSVLDAATGDVLRRIDLSPYPQAPAGSSPNGLTVSPDGGTLYVANAGDNSVAVVRLASDARGQDTVAGLIPTAWYPSSVQLVSNGAKLLVTSAKGLGIGPNPGGPNPYTDKWNDPVWESQYAYGMVRGQLSIVDVPNHEQLAHYTKQVQRNDGFDEHGPTTEGTPENSVIPSRIGQESPIKHIIYVIKENRTYDQVLGDLAGTNGDAKLALFGERITPNQHRLAQQFVALDNFYNNGEVSGQGWQWVSGADANTHAEKTNPGAYSFDRYPAPTPGNAHVDDASRNPEASYIWDELIAAHKTLRDYGWFADGAPGAAQAYANAPELNAYLDKNYPGWTLGVTDRDRIKEWQREYANYEQTDTLPAFQMLQLPNDHTNGTTAGGLTPKAMVADNDYALGQLVDTVSHSKDWASTAIFVVEDDAQDGPDHVDAHRSVAQVISPYTQRGKGDSTLYSQMSALHTIELILGLPPMSQFDAAATPMYKSFGHKPNLAPYTAILPAQDMNERNSGAAPMAQQSATWNFSKPDAAPHRDLNEAIWKSVKGADSTMPAPMDHGKPAGPGSVWADPDDH